MPAKKKPAAPSAKKKAPSPTGPSKSKSKLTAVAKALGVVDELPAAVHAFVDAAAATRLDWPDFDDALVVRPAAPELPAFHEYAVSGFGGDARSRFPSAAVGKDDGTFFIAVDLTSDALAVSFFDYESGWHPLADRLVDLAPLLLHKGEPTRAQKAAQVQKIATALHESGKHKQALALVAELHDHGPSLHLAASATAALGDVKEAERLHKAAWELGERESALALVKLAGDDVKQVIARAEPLLRAILSFVDEDAWFRVRLVLVDAYLKQGDLVRAAAMAHAIRRFFHSDKKRMKLAAVAIKAHAAGAEILAWFDRPSVAPDVDAATAKAWWATVPAALQKRIKSQAEDAVGLMQLDNVSFDGSKTEGSLAFLAAMPRLRTLSLREMGLVDVSVLAACTSLGHLDLEGNPIASLAPLKALTKLRHLNVCKSALTNLAGVEGMRRLEVLWANDAAVVDVTALAGLPELEEAHLNDNEIESIESLATCMRLKEITASRNPLKSAKGCLALPRLRTFEIENSSPEMRQNMWAQKPYLKVQYFADPPMPALSDDDKAAWVAWLAHAKTLPGWRAVLANVADEPDNGTAIRDAFFEETVLLAADKGITDIAPLVRFARLNYASVSGNSIADLAPLAAGMPLLDSLTIDRNRVTSLAPLANLPLLARFSCTSNQVTSLAGLESVSPLRKLDVARNAVVDLAPLANADELRE
ncbi:MAG TPA: hypothetical protein VGO62_10545, partial [Myxococcota bacterium]